MIGPHKPQGHGVVFGQACHDRRPDALPSEFTLSRPRPHFNSRRAGLSLRSRPEKVRPTRTLTRTVTVDGVAVSLDHTVDGAAVGVYITPPDQTEPEVRILCHRLSVALCRLIQDRPADL